MSSPVVVGVCVGVAVAPGVDVGVAVAVADGVGVGVAAGQPASSSAKTKPILATNTIKFFVFTSLLLIIFLFTLILKY